jgi:putative transposase
MIKTFHYRIYPTKAQRSQLRLTLELCRLLWNAALQQRRAAYRLAGKSLSYQDQQNELPALKAACPEFKNVHSLVLQDVLHRLDRAFAAFFRRVQAGQTPGFPRFRGQGRYDSLTYPQYGNGAKLNDAQLQLSKIGNLKVVVHHPLAGTPKTVTIRCSATGKWYVSIVCEGVPQALPASPEKVGIDVGLAAFVTLSSGDQIPNPRFFRQEEWALGQVQRQHAQLPQGSRQRRKHRRAVARVHERVKFRRENFAHQQSRRIVNRYQIIAVEDLAVNGLMRNHGLAKSIADAAWTQFNGYLAYKAVWAGRQYVPVNPAYTSQDCSNCGHRQKMPLGERVYNCPCCQLSLDRDHNAARNILALGLQRIGSQSVEAPGFIRGE